MRTIRTWPFILFTLLATVGSVVFVRCDQGGSTVYPTSTRFINAHAARLSKSELRAATCPSGYVCVTPTNLEGRIYSGGLMVGSQNGYSITTLGATAEIRRRPDLGSGGTQAFNIAKTTTISGDYQCCGGSPYPADSDAVVSRLEFNFDYLDTTFMVPTEAQAGVAINDAIEGKTYTIRLVYVNSATVGTDDDMPAGAGATIQMGDKLVKEVTNSRTDAFYWCDQVSCNYSTRPNSPLQDTDIADFTPPSQGNSNYDSFAIQMTNPVTFTLAEAQQGGWLFKVSFDLTNAAMFTPNWTTFAHVADMIEGFKLMASPGSGEDASSITVTLTKEQGS